MPLLRFADGLDALPLPASEAQAALGLERWRDALAETAETDPGLDRAAGESKTVLRLLEALFGSSPFLTEAAIVDPAFTLRLLNDGPDDALTYALAAIDAAGEMQSATLSTALRIAKRRVALTVAVADIANAWPLAKVTDTLSAFADNALSASAGHLLSEAAKAGAFHLKHPETPERDSGLIVLGMGKLGARELNYSSDIDLIVLYDTDRIQTDNPDNLQSHFVRLARNLVRLMQERTVDGYVFRMDLRLRPDPGATPLALSAIAAETYYESLGQNWERAAMIKARPVAGDKEAGDVFLDRLRPFIWRRSLDFAAIQDIHSIKRQINAHRGGAEIAVAGHNIKLGRGGIREIEFFAQTQQLIWGGREPRLRLAGTLDAIHALVQCGLVTENAERDLRDAYEFLRRVEHRLQMIADEQTQKLPDNAAGLRTLALFLGLSDADAFSMELLKHLRAVERHYAALFEDAPDLSAGTDVPGNLVFTGAEADPDTIETLKRIGFNQPGSVDATVRGWHHGRYRAMRSTKAREMLTELMPVLLKALASTSDPDAAFARFDEFLSNLPAGVQIFSMFHSHPDLLGLIAEILGKAPRLAEHMSRRPIVIDGLIAPQFADAPPGLAAELDGLNRLLTPVSHIEEAFDACRRWSHDRRFQIGVKVLRGLISPADAARGLSDVAEAALSLLMPRVEAEFRRHHGRFPGMGLGVAALGKLGGREMTPTSDLDLVLIYDVSEDAEASQCEKPLAPSQYYARLAQRLVNAVTALTAEGRLYEVDLRLRPSGNKGPLSVSLEAFRRYDEEGAAWTWEHLALTRARAVAGTEAMKQRIDEEIRTVLVRPRDREKLLTDVASMRARMAAERPGGFIWDVKNLRGGLIDVEFIAQYLQLAHAHDLPDVLSPNTRDALTRLHRAGLLTAADSGALLDALGLWQALQGMLRLALVAEPKRGRDAPFPPSLAADLTRIVGAVDFAGLEGKIRDTAAGVMGVFDRLIAGPAAALPTATEERKG